MLDRLTVASFSAVSVGSSFLGSVVAFGFIKTVVHASVVSCSSGVCSAAVWNEGPTLLDKTCTGSPILAKRSKGLVLVARDCDIVDSLRGKRRKGERICRSRAVQGRKTV